MNRARTRLAAALLLLALAAPAHGADADAAANAAPAPAPTGAPPPAAAPPAAPALVTAVTDEQLMELLREEGYAPTFERPGILRMKIESMNVVFFVAEDNRSLQAFAGFKSATTSLEQVNAWNRSRRFSRAYLDADGDPVIELDLDIAGGVTRERLLDYIRTVRVSVLAFVKAIFEGKP